VVPRDDVRGVELEIADVLRRLEDRARARSRRAIEELRLDREAARLRERDPVFAYATGTCGCFSGARSRKFTMSSSDSGDS
jgi:hypothetical protein